MALPTIGHLDPVFLELMDETMDLLRFVFRTENTLTFPVSGTGSAGMECAFVNLVEPGDSVVICVHGVFGERMCDVASRCGAEVTRVDAAWGKAIDPDDLRTTVAAAAPKIVAIVHAETSTGVLQPMEEISAIAHEAGALLLMDCVTSLGGVDVRLDDWGVDIAYSGTQKCLSCPPGLAPISFSVDAEAAMDARQCKVASWYLDVSMIRNYWGQERAYHHTAPINAIYGLREALRLVAEEGLEARQARHSRQSRALQAGIEAMGLGMFVAPEYRLPSLNTVRIPEGADDATTRAYLLRRYGLEIGGGLGPVKGQVWRVGLMGASCTEENVLFFLLALEQALKAQGVKVGSGVAAAQRSWDRETE